MTVCCTFPCSPAVIDGGCAEANHPGLERIADNVAVKTETIGINAFSCFRNKCVPAELNNIGIDIQIGYATQHLIGILGKSRFNPGVLDGVVLVNIQAYFGHPLEKQLMQGE